MSLGGGNSQSFTSGFKLVNPTNFGDNHAGSFTVTYTLTSLQDELFAAKAGNYSNDASFTIADFQSVLDCGNNVITGPQAVNDETTTPLNTPVVIDAFANDVKGSSDIDKTFLAFVGTVPDPATVGTFTFDNLTHKVTFTPANNYVGIATIDYQIKDANGLTSIATIKVTISSGSNNNFPATGFSTLAFEDLWPYKGDYDMNDLVLDYKFEISANSGNYVDKVVGTFVIKAFGATLENGFGFQLPGIAKASDLTVSGYSLKENFINLGSKPNQPSSFTIMPSNK
jgi:Surface adhesin CshA repetitive domain